MVSLIRMKQKYKNIGSYVAKLWWLLGMQVWETFKLFLEIVKFQNSPDKRDELLKERFYQKARRQMWYEGKGGRSWRGGNKGQKRQKSEHWKTRQGPRSECPVIQTSRYARQPDKSESFKVWKSKTNGEQPWKFSEQTKPL